MADNNTSVDSSILTSVKLSVDIQPDDNSFDTRIIISINTALNKLTQAGCGIENTYITDDSTTWGDFLGDDVDKLPMVKSYVILHVRKEFDPPSNATVMNSIDNQLNDYLTRIYLVKDTERIKNKAQ